MFISPVFRSLVFVLFQDLIVTLILMYNIYKKLSRDYVLYLYDNQLSGYVNRVSLPNVCVAVCSSCEQQAIPRSEEMRMMCMLC